MKVINKQTNKTCDMFIWDGCADHVPADLLNAANVAFEASGNNLTVDGKVVYLGAAVVIDDVVRIYWSTRTLVKYYNFEDESIQKMYESWITEESKAEAKKGKKVEAKK